MSDFKSNEYANLIGGKYFEPEENPMIGFRVLPLLQRFLERVCPRMRSDEKVKMKWGFNVKLMIPFAEPWKKEKSIGRDGRQ
jgi:pyruvate,water dikinase